MQEDVCLDTFNASNESEFIQSLVHITDPNITDNFGNSLVHRAIMEGMVEISSTVFFSTGSNTIFGTLSKGHQIVILN